ncbi:MAG: phospholipid/cholesterol/gamma-HCH transport system permease protein, partial [Actinomycetota bacterium]|nr:phospholipid/cholesterol/gamma-HCH transport system permease protein [Actinomycetota bacterium]
MTVASATPPVVERARRIGSAIVSRPLAALDDLGAQLSFYARSLFWSYRTLLRYKKEVVRLLAEVSLGTG